MFPLIGNHNNYSTYDIWQEISKSQISIAINYQHGHSTHWQHLSQIQYKIWRFILEENKRQKSYDNCGQSHNCY